MKKPTITADQIDAILPQTQCGLCGYNGCMPYADALANHTAPINLCPPGGVKGLQQLAALLNQDATPFIEDMEKKAKAPAVAVIREAECIGCTKCINVCPTDAILGAAKLMHTVITDECTGCELCIAPCPVDCIDMKPVSVEQDKAEQFRMRYRNRSLRLQAVKANKEVKKADIQAALLRAKQKKSL